MNIPRITDAVAHARDAAMTGYAVPGPERITEDERALLVLLVQAEREASQGLQAARDAAKQIEERALQLQQRAYIKQMAWVFALEERYLLHPGDTIDAESGIIRRVTFDDNGVREPPNGTTPDVQPTQHEPRA